MKIDVEKDQEFLALAYSLQTNWSNAASTPKHLMWKIMPKKVYSAYDYRQRKTVYALEPICLEMEDALKVPVMRSNGRKPISKEKVEEIQRMRLEGHSVRSIAKEVGVGRGTVEKYMKED